MEAVRPCDHLAAMSRPRGRLASLATGLVLAVASGCNDEPPLPPIVWEGEHLRFGTDADDSTICAGTLPYLDGVVGHLGEVFGRPDVRVSYYWLPDGTEVYCPDAPEGCVNDRGTFSRHTIHQHELVHAVRWPGGLYHPFEEGLAEAFGDDWNRFPVQGDIRDLLEDPVGNHYLPGAGYGLAAHFVSYLNADYGLETLIEFDASTDYEQSYASASAAFERVYDEPLDDVVDEYESEYPRCDQPTLRHKEYDCSRNVVEVSGMLGERVERNVSLSCDDQAVLGPRLGKRWTTMTLDIEVRGRYFINGRPSQEDRTFDFVEISRCDLSCFDYGDDELSRVTGNYLGGGHCVDPGKYLFRFSVDESVDNDYVFNIERADYPPCD
jgi:hypothetical protein